LRRLKDEDPSLDIPDFPEVAVDAGVGGGVNLNQGLKKSGKKSSKMLSKANSASGTAFDFESEDLDQSSSDEYINKKVDNKKETPKDLLPHFIA